MTSRPSILTWGAAALAVIAVSMPIQIAIIYEHGPSEWDLVWQKLTVMNLLCMGLFGMCAYGSWQGSAWLAWAMPASLGTALVNNTLVAWHGEDFGPLWPHVGTLAYAIIPGAYVMSQKVRFLMAHPDRCWWKATPRVPRTFKAWANWGQGEVVRSQTFDISQSGLFLNLAQEQLLRLASDNRLKLGQEVHLTVEIPGATENASEKIRLKATVVRVMGVSLGHYPTGVGLKIRGEDLSATFSWWKTVRRSVEATVHHISSNSGGGSNSQNMAA